jgi:hypothetical protein
MPRVKFTQRMEADLKKDLEELADKDGRSLSNYIETKLLEIVIKSNAHARCAKHVPKDRKSGPRKKRRSDYK